MVQDERQCLLLFHLDHHRVNGLDPPIDWQTIATVWKDDPAQFTREFDQSSQNFGAISIVNAIALSVHQIAEPAYKQLLIKTAWKRSTCPDHRSMLLNEVLRAGHTDVVRDFESRFLAIVAHLQTKHTKPRLVDVDEYVTRLCHWRCYELAPHLSTLTEINRNRPDKRRLFGAGTEALIDAALARYEGSHSAMQRIAEDCSSHVALREACIFCLGCEQEGELAPAINALYWNSPGDELQWIRIACIDAIVRCGSADTVNNLVKEALGIHDGEREALNTHNPEITALFRAIYVSSSVSEEVKRAAMKWSDSTNEVHAANARVALERHGALDPIDMPSSSAYAYAAYRRLRHGWRATLSPLPSFTALDH